MNLGLLLPGALVSLAALLLPLLIHLARRNQQQPLDFAALRWLNRKPKPRRRLRVDDIPLLLLRLLLLALMALWLAKPVLYGAPDRRAYVAVMPGVAATTLAMQVLPANARKHWLAVGFPNLESAPPADAQPIASLLRQLDAELPYEAPLVVLATARFDGADARLPILSRNVDWRIVAGAPPSTPTVAAPAAPRLQIRSDAAHRTQAGYLHAASRAWQTPATSTATTTSLPTEHQTVLVWFASEPLPAPLLAWVAHGGTALLDADHAFPHFPQPVSLWQNAAGDALLQAAAHGNGRLLRFTQPLQPAQMPELLNAEFPQRLRDALQAPVATPIHSDARTYRPQTGANTYPQAPYALQSWLALLLALLFLCERWLATGRRGEQA
ncbi:MAG TPA: BatA domain-containing protein [Thermomonas sp.]|jgi:hypothetical protein|nr:BatA domain-containing protein [Thermomonas sp.]HQY48968.1 BatA domain-containing protein [Thermomonas sp.]HRA55883.1 BatA domain-containing protein [Thermomonas sp.]